MYFNERVARELQILYICIISGKWFYKYCLATISDQEQPHVNLVEYSDRYSNDFIGCLFDFFITLFLKRMGC